MNPNSNKVEKLRIKLGNWFFGKKINAIDDMGNLGWLDKDEFPQYFALEWNPFRDSNQSNNIWNKMLTEISNEGRFSVRTTTEYGLEEKSKNRFIRAAFIAIEKIDTNCKWNKVVESQGVDERDARINVILKYIKGKK